jgi:hypothetical protein
MKTAPSPLKEALGCCFIFRNEMTTPEESLFMNHQTDILAFPPEAIVPEPETQLSSQPIAVEVAAETAESPTLQVIEGDGSIVEDKHPGWLRRNLFKLSAGTFLGGTALSFITNPFANLEHKVVEVAPWTLGGIATTEGLWIGGAAMMAAGMGKAIGNPLKLKNRWSEISSEIAANRLTKTGLAINTLGAIGTAGVIAAGAAHLPPETWPGAFGAVALDVASTVALRAMPYAAIRKARADAPEQAQTPKPFVRHAKLDDVERLADLDLSLFKKAYGKAPPDKADLMEMFTSRIANNPNWMFVAELDGVVEGFVTAFRTNVPLENFVSWEHSTADGTLDDKVDPHGKYGYVVNMTIGPTAVKAGAEDMLLANLFANGISAGLEYAYFVSRMPLFRRWLLTQNISPITSDESNLNDLAQQFSELRRDGKLRDPELKMYESFGFKREQLVPNGFQDEASLNYGVVLKAEIPAQGRFAHLKPVRTAMAFGLRQVAKHPKLLKKVL